jgi:hypothetical protein
MKLENAFQDLDTFEAQVKEDKDACFVLYYSEEENAYGHVFLGVENLRVDKMCDAFFAGIAGLILKKQVDLRGAVNMFERIRGDCERLKYLARQTIRQETGGIIRPGEEP